MFEGREIQYAYDAYAVRVAQSRAVGQVRPGLVDSRTKSRMRATMTVSLREDTMYICTQQRVKTRGKVSNWHAHGQVDRILDPCLEGV